MGNHDQGGEHIPVPARPPLAPVRARKVTARLRKATDDVRRSVPVLAVPVHRALRSDEPARTR